MLKLLERIRGEMRTPTFRAATWTVKVRVLFAYWRTRKA